MTNSDAYRINELMVKHGFSPISIGERFWGQRVIEFIVWLSAMAGDIKVQAKD